MKPFGIILVLLVLPPSICINVHAEGPYDINWHGIVSPSDIDGVLVNNYKDGRYNELLIFSNINIINYAISIKLVSR